MKIDKKTARQIETNINKVLNGIGKEKLLSAYANGNIPNADRVRDINVRLRWDLFFAASRTYGMPEALSRPDITDNHIDTCLKRIVPAVPKS